MSFFIPYRIIGLDIGTDAIKAVRVVRGLKGFKVTGFAKKKRENNSPLDNTIPLSEEIKELLDSKSMEGDLYVTSIPSDSVAVRNMRLPFSNLNKVRQVIKYEVESVLPFLIDDILLDFRVLDKRLKDGTDLLVVAALKVVVKAHLDAMKIAGIEPEIVDLNASAPFYCLGVMEYVKEDRIVSIIDIGAGKTCVSIVGKGGLQLIRSIPVGGEAITREISEALSVDLHTAEELKRKEGTILYEHIENRDESVKNDGTKLKVSKAITDTMDRLKGDIDLLFSFYNTLPCHGDISEILLTGGTSNIENIDEYFEREFRVKTSLFKPLSFIPNSIGNIRTHDESTLTGALGLALRGARGSGLGFNFRKDEYSYKNKDTDVRKSLVFIVIGLFLAFSLYMGNMFTCLHLKEKRYARSKAEIRSVFTHTFPDVKNIVNEFQQMKRKISEEKDSDVSLAGAQGGASYLGLLREISTRIPVGKDIKITRMRMNNENISLIGEANSFDTVDKMKALLKGSKLLENIEIKDAKMSTRKGVVSFDIRIR